MTRFQALPFLGPSRNHTAEDGAESLGAHCEGPFLNPTKNGVHNVDVLIEAETFADLEACYGAENLNPQTPGGDIPVKMITAAPERGSMMKLIPEITGRGIRYSVGHSEATYEEASEAVGQGATMITHLFNAMRPLHHRNPGIFGVLGEAESLPRPYFGIISDGIHLHPTTIKIAFNAHPDGFILVTDAMHLVGLPDGAYPWTNGETTANIVKKGSKLLLENSDTIAGRYVILIVPLFLLALGNRQKTPAYAGGSVESDTFMLTCFMQLHHPARVRQQLPRLVRRRHPRRSQGRHCDPRRHDGSGGCQGYARAWRRRRPDYPFRGTDCQRPQQVDSRRGLEVWFQTAPHRRITVFFGLKLLEDEEEEERREFSFFMMLFFSFVIFPTSQEKATIRAPRL